MPTRPITNSIPAPHGWQLLPLHDYCKLFPETTEEDYDNLVTSMKNDGYYESNPIVLIDDDEGDYFILDGRNRHAAAIDTGQIPSFVEYTGEKPLQFVIAANLNRRHMTTGQKAALASKIANMQMGDNQFTPGAVTQPEAAAIVNVGTASIRRYKKLENDAPEIAEKVAAGEISLAQAKKEADSDTQPTDEAKGLGNKTKEKREARKKKEEQLLEKERREFVDSCLFVVHEEYGLTSYDDMIRAAIRHGMAYTGR